MKYTSEIFQRLSNGKFISANSIDPMNRSLYRDIEENQQDYTDYFSQIDFLLCAGDGYFYFSRKEPKINVENKLQGLLQWIDYLDFLKSKDKLQNLFAEKSSNRDKLETLVGKLFDMGFAEQVSEIEGMYQVTSAFLYIENIIDCVNISEEVSDEIPE